MICLVPLFFVYLQLRSALRAHGVPWNSKLQEHPFLKVIIPTEHICSASSIYISLLKALHTPLGTCSVWSKDLNLDEQTSSLNRTWGEILLSSKNPDHQMIHWKFLHRYYLTPLKRYYMHLSQTPTCNLCNLEQRGTLMHYFWFCPTVLDFWHQLADDLTTLVEQKIPCSPSVFLLNDFSSFNISLQQKRLLLCVIFILSLYFAPPHRGGGGRGRYGLNVFLQSDNC